MSVSVIAADDPYKKYWVAILAGFGLTAFWLCLPLMDTPIGSTHVQTSRPATDADVEQNLSAAESPLSAPGGVVVPDQVAAALPFTPSSASAAPAAGAPNLAQALKSVAARKDAGGWGGEKAQRGFVSPKLSGTSISGLGGGAASGGGSAGAGAAPSAATGRAGSVGGVGGVGIAGAFGAHNAQTGAVSARGLKDLNASADAATRAAAARSGDAARGGLSRVFDGAKGRAEIAGAGGGAGAGTYAALDAAPVNLKLNDPKLSSKEIKEPPSSAAPVSSNSGAAFAQQMGGMIISTVLGGLIGGGAGQMVASVGMQMVQMQAQRQQEESQQAAQQKIRARVGL